MSDIGKRTEQTVETLIRILREFGQEGLTIEADGQMNKAVLALLIEKHQLRWVNYLLELGVPPSQKAYGLFYQEVEDAIEMVENES